ncbi:MAG: hypothetical protein FJW26_02205 [Acidimicrobiia bacterium]|nr:hypothetical protein [Acidimicrobiia bacterium]
MSPIEERSHQLVAPRSCSIATSRPEEVLKLVAPAHRASKQSTLSHILKQARLAPKALLKLL